MSYVRLAGYVIEVDPLAVNAFYDTLSAEYHTVGIILGEGVENTLDLLAGELFGSLCTEA